jgi:hypothetical protein
LPSLHDTGTPAQLPALHLSPVVQRSPSLHDTLVGEWTHPEDGLQLSSVQMLPSSQLRGVLWQLCEPVQCSFSVQRSVSTQSVSLLQQPPMDECWQPVDGAQESAVQGLWSSQSGAVPGRQTPELQRSRPLQRLPSPQLVPSSSGVFTHPTVETQLSCVQGLLSPQFRGSLVQLPATQRSFTVQASPSTQSLSETQQPATAACVHPLPESQASTVHGLPSSQSGAVPWVQVPDWQVSRPLQGSRSPQVCPLGTGVKVHPVAASQPSVVHGLPSSHVSGSLTHPWDTQRSLTVQAEESVQSASVLQHPAMVCTVQPVLESQPSTVQAFPSSQVGGVPGVQVPPWQVSVPLHTLPSPQPIPSTTGRLRQPIAASHESFVQGFPSSQFTVSLTHEPPTQRSFVVQALLSPQSAAVTQQPGVEVWRQPPGGAHESAVQGLSSSQSRGGPFPQCPPWQVSSPLQTLPSEHEEPSGWSSCWQPAAGSHESWVQGLLSSQFTGSLTQAPLSHCSWSAH